MRTQVVADRIAADYDGMNSLEQYLSRVSPAGRKIKEPCLPVEIGLLGASLLARLWQSLASNKHLLGGQNSASTFDISL